MVFKEGEKIPRVVQALGLGAVLLAIFLVMFGEFSATTLNTIVVVNNTPVGQINFTGANTEFTLAHNSSEFAFKDILNDTVVVSNVTDTFLNSVKIGNWTVNTLTGTIQLHAGDAFLSGLNNTGDESSFYNVSYSYRVGDQAKLSIDRIIDSFDRISGFWQVLAVGAMAGLILVVLVVVFPFGGAGGGDSEGERF